MDAAFSIRNPTFRISERTPGSIYWTCRVSIPAGRAENAGRSRIAGLDIDFTQPKLLVVLDKTRKEEDDAKKAVENHAKIVKTTEGQNYHLPASEQVLTATPPDGKKQEKNEQKTVKAQEDGQDTAQIDATLMAEKARLYQITMTIWILSKYRAGERFICVELKRTYGKSMQKLVKHVYKCYIESNGSAQVL